jgi:hypothetical protein
MCVQWYDVSGLLFYVCDCVCCVHTVRMCSVRDVRSCVLASMWLWIACLCVMCLWLWCVWLNMVCMSDVCVIVCILKYVFYLIYLMGWCVFICMCVGALCGYPCTWLCLCCAVCGCECIIVCVTVCLCLPVHMKNKIQSSSAKGVLRRECLPKFYFPGFPLFPNFLSVICSAWPYSKVNFFSANGNYVINTFSSNISKCNLKVD